MKLYEIVLPLAAIALLAFAVRWQFFRTMDSVTSAHQPGVIPISTPFISTLCGPDNQDCKHLEFKFNVQKP